jgi:TonB family protein
MNPSARATLVAVFCLSCASGRAPQAPSQPEPSPVCFTGVGAIEIPSPVAPAPRRDTSKEAYGIGGLGLVGTGATTHGTIDAARSTGVTSVIPGMPVFHGAVERDDLRRTVRDHVPELATCPDAAGPSRGLIGGRIVVDFVIDPQGRVERSSIRSSTISDHTIDTCVGQQACRWTFAAPRDGGKAVVSYPLVFTPELRK